MTPSGVMLHECELVAENLARKEKEYHKRRTPSEISELLRMGGLVSKLLRSLLSGPCSWRSLF